VSEDREGKPLVPQLETPADPQPPKLWVHRPHDQRGILVVSLSAQLYSYGTHYVPQLTADRGCRGRWEDCHWCRDGYDWREKHYLSIVWPKTGTIGLLELTAGAVQHCLQLTDKSRNWRGYQLVVRRMLKKRNSPERVEVGARRTDIVLPPEPDVYAALLRHWGDADPRHAGGPS